MALGIVQEIRFPPLHQPPSLLLPQFMHWSLWLFPLNLAPCRISLVHTNSEKVTEQEKKKEEEALNWIHFLEESRLLCARWWINAWD